MKSKILLITSNFEKVSLFNASFENPLGVKTGKYSHYPLGIAYLHSYLESRGHEIHSLCLNHLDDEECFKVATETLANFSPKVVGLQILSANRVSSYKLIEYIHKNYPHINLVIGGIHATIMYKQLLEKYPFLIIVLGEGEITLAELIDELQRENPNLSNINGIAFNLNDEIIKTKPRGLIENLDILPRLKHELFFDGKRNSGGILTSRGCPFNCSFCVLDTVSRKKVRYRSVKNVVDEIEYLTNKFQEMKEIWIHDDSFFLDNQRVIEICEEIVKRKIKMEFVCSGRMKPVSKELVKKLEAANFKLVNLGLESGNEKILQMAHKNITKADVVKVFKLFSDSLVALFTFLIIGLPGETPETLMETIKFVKKLQKIKYVLYKNMAILTIYPGTEVYEIAKAYGIINDDFWLSDKSVPLFTVEHSQKELFDYKEIMLNHLSLDRFWTRAGFKAQFTMIPWIIKHLFKSGMIKIFLIKKLKKFLPKGLYELLKRQYKSLFFKKV